MSKEKQNQDIRETNFDFINLMKDIKTNEQKKLVETILCDYNNELKLETYINMVEDINYIVYNADEKTLESLIEMERAQANIDNKTKKPTIRDILVKLGVFDEEE